MQWAISGAVLVAVVGTIVAEYRGPRWLVYLCKPLTTSLILLLAVLRTGTAERFFAVAIVVGLVCSLAGDIWLMLPGDYFVPGLVSFLLAHLVYVAAFLTATPGVGAGPALLTLGGYLLYGVGVFWRLRPALGRLQGPVMVYMLAIVAMVWCATEWWRQTMTLRALSGMVGAIWFVVSDTMLAFNRFAGRFGVAQALILGSYFLAQWLIALAV